MRFITKLLYNKTRKVTNTRDAGLADQNRVFYYLLVALLCAGSQRGLSVSALFLNPTAMQDRSWARSTRIECMEKYGLCGSLNRDAMSPMIPSLSSSTASIITPALPVTFLPVRSILALHPDLGVIVVKYLALY